jgi:hypothetical protein
MIKRTKTVPENNHGPVQVQTVGGENNSENKQAWDALQANVDKILESVAKDGKPIVLTSTRPAGFVKPRQPPVERAAAYFFLQTNPRGLDQTTDLERREFLFHCLYVPLYSIVAIRFATTMLGSPALMLHEYAVYSLAFERMLLEMILLQKSNKNEKFKAKTLIDIFTNQYNGYDFWRERFEEWKSSVVKSHSHFMRKKVPDITKGGQTAVAALLGNVLSGGQQLPMELFGGMIERIEKNKSLFKTLSKNALKPNPARWGEPELDAWLIEIWPLVTRYGWNYRDVWQAAVKKWGDKCQEDESFGSVQRIEDRCKKMLGLRLGSRGQTRGGRVTGDPQHPLLSKFAISIRSIGMEDKDWFLGGPIIRKLTLNTSPFKSRSKARAT